MTKYRYKILIEYDGTDFCGWQKQAVFGTVQSNLEAALKHITQSKVTVFGCGRTDAGVHAIGQVAHFDLDKPMPAFRIKEGMNGYLKDLRISILAAQSVDSNFDARFGAKERSYVYLIFNRRERPSLYHNKAWWIIKTLDYQSMNKAAKCLIGKHDFSTFRAAGCQSSSPIKTLNNIRVTKRGDMIIVFVKAQSFLYHQVRNIVGSLVCVGSHKWTINDFKNIFLLKDRTKAGPTAPACGLYFYKVTY